jgi:hypothetical protein
MKLVLACGLYRGRGHRDACTTDIEIHSDSVKHSPLGLLSFYGRDEAPRRAFGTSPTYNPPSTCQSVENPISLKIIRSTRPATNQKPVRFHRGSDIVNSAEAADGLFNDVLLICHPWRPYNGGM